MKTLTYVVADRLYQSETGPEAQVGDQVTLWLDVDNNPELPESIFGIIQPPIRRTGCCEESTVYQIEYDETGLEGNILRPDDVIKVTTAAAIDVVAGDLGELAAEFDLHVSNLSNPHVVTKAQVGLGNADNTSDVNKPVSSATQTALNSKANLNGATLTNVTISTGDVTRLLVNGGYVGMENTNVASSAQVAGYAQLRIPKLSDHAADPAGITFNSLLVFPDGNDNPNFPSVFYYGTYSINGAVNGKNSYVGGTLQMGTPRGKITWDLSGYWVLESNIVGLVLTVWRKTAANLTDNAPWVPQTTTNGEQSGDIFVKPQIFLPGQPIKPTNTSHKLAIQSTTSGAFHYLPLMGATASVYADDTAAAAGGVLIGEYYKKTGGTVAWRQV